MGPDYGAVYYQTKQRPSSQPETVFPFTVPGQGGGWQGGKQNKTSPNHLYDCIHVFVNTYAWILTPIVFTFDKDYE